MASIEELSSLAKPVVRAREVARRAASAVSHLRGSAPEVQSCAQQRQNYLPCIVALLRAPYALSIFHSQLLPFLALRM